MKNYILCAVLFIYCLAFTSCTQEKDLMTNIEFEDVSNLKSSGIPYDGDWSPWMCQNYNGHERTKQFLETSKPELTGLKIREQSGYGVINIGLLGKDINGIPLESDWTTTNQRGRFIEKSFPNSIDYATGIEIKEQSGYGVIDIKLFSQRNVSTGWLTNNPKGQRFWREDCPDGYKIVGISVREQSGYGVVNVKVFMTKI